LHAHEARKNFSDAYDLNLKERPRIETRRLDADRAGICVRAPASSGPPGRILTRSSNLRNTRCVNLTLAVMLAIHISARPATTAVREGSPLTERRNHTLPYHRFRALAPIYMLAVKTDALITINAFSAAAIIKFYLFIYFYFK